MRVLVTGGAGYIGSVTVELLLDEGHEVVVFDNFERGHRQAVDKRARLIEGDLRDRNAILRAVKDVKPGAVLHFAAYALVGESMQFPERYFLNNVAGGINLVDAMLGAGVGHIVFSSTCATYGDPVRIPMTEDLPQKPTNPYGESKLMFEKVLLWHERVHGIRPVFLRYFNAAGATEKYGEDHDPETHLIPNVLRAAEKNTRVRVFGDDYDTPDGTCIRDYIHIVDLAQAHLLALGSGVAGAYNLGNGSGYSVMEVIETARRVTGRSIDVEIAPRRPGDPPRLVAAASKAQEELGWRPRYPALETIIRDAWNWHRAHPEGYAE